MGNNKFKPAKVGDWVYCNGDCFGILMHIFTKRYAPYDEVPEDSVVGDVEYRIGQYKIFAKNDGTIYKRNRVKFDDCCLDQITEKDKIRLNKIIEQNQSEYQNFMSIEKEVYEQWFAGIFTKTICEAKNRNQLMKAITMAEELGLTEGEDFFLIKDNCLTELEPEEVDENGVGRTLTCIGFRPLPDEVAHKISRKYQLYR